MHSTPSLRDLPVARRGNPNKQIRHCEKIRRIFVAIYIFWIRRLLRAIALAMTKKVWIVSAIRANRFAMTIRAQFRIFLTSQKT